MGIALILLGFPLSIVAWIFIARKLKQKNYSGLSRHLAGFAGSFVVWWVCAITGAMMSPETMEAAKADAAKTVESNNTPTAAEETPPVVVKESAPTSIPETPAANESKAKQDANVNAFFERTKNYRADDGELVINDASQNKYTIKPTIGMGLANSDDIQSDVNRAMWEGVYRVFAHVPVDSIDVTIAPQIAKGTEAKSEEMKRLKDFNIHIKTTRAEALAALQKHAGVQSFDELVDFTGELGAKGTLQSKTFLALRKDPVKSYLIYKDIAAK